MKSPGSASKLPASLATDAPADPPSSGRRDSGKGQRKGKPAVSTDKTPGGGDSERKGQTGGDMVGGYKDGNSEERGNEELSVTPSRRTSSLVPQAIAMATNSTTFCTSPVATMDIDPVSMDTGVPMEIGCEPMEIGGEIAIGDTTLDSVISQTLPIMSDVPPLLRRALNLSDSSHDCTPSTDIPSTSKRQAAVRVKQERADTPVSRPGLIVKQEEPSVVKRESPSAELEAALVEFCTEALDRGVLSLREIQDQLLVKQTSVFSSHPLWEHGISEAQLESALRVCGAVEVGKPLGKRLFALTHGDQVTALRIAIEILPTL